MQLYMCQHAYRVVTQVLCQFSMPYTICIIKNHRLGMVRMLQSLDCDNYENKQKNVQDEQ